MRESVFWKTDWFLAAVIAQVRLGLSRTALLPGLDRLFRAPVFLPRFTPVFKGWRSSPWAGGAFGTSAPGLTTVPMPTYIFNYPEGRSACTSDAVFFPLPAKIPPDEYGKRIIPMGDIAAPVGISRIPPLSHGMPPVFTLAHSVSLAPEKYLCLENSTGDSDGNSSLRPCSALLGVAAAPGEWSGSGSDGGRRRVVAGGSPFACRQVLRTGGARRGGVGYLLGGIEPQLGMAFNGEGEHDMAFANLREYPSGNTFMESLCNPPGDLEWKLQSCKGQTACHTRTGRNPEFRALAQKRPRVWQMVGAAVLGGPGARTDSCPGLRDGGRVEKPMRSRKQVNEQLGSGATRPAYPG